MSKSFYIFSGRNEHWLSWPAHLDEVGGEGVGEENLMTRGGKFHLAKVVGTRYRFALEESWFHEDYEGKEADRIWYEIIPCQGEETFIGLYSLEPVIFQLSTSRPRNARQIWERIKDHPGTRADFVFDGEAILYFPKELVSLVAEMAGARKKRTRAMTPEQKAELAERGKAFRFSSAKHGDTEPKTPPILNDPAPRQGVGRTG